MGTVLTGLEKITHLCTRCAIYESLYLHNQTTEVQFSLQDALVVLYVRILKFLAQTMRMCQRNIASRLMHTIVDSTVIKNFIDDCQPLEVRIEIEASNCERVYYREMKQKSNEATSKLRKMLHGLEEPIIRIDSRIAAISGGLDNQERSRTQQWISNVPFLDNHAKAREARTPGTCQWLLQNTTYRDWRSSSASTVLWLHGARRFYLHSFPDQFYLLQTVPKYCHWHVLTFSMFFIY
jgi:hypothetical protein